MIKPQILFMHDVRDTHFWKDGLWMAMHELEKDFTVVWKNLAENRDINQPLEDFDFVLGWSSLTGEIATIISELDIPKGLCIGGVTENPEIVNKFDVLFFETYWFAERCLRYHKNAIHAFGINTDIFSEIDECPKIFDYITIGAFSDWKRQPLLIKKPGVKMAIGQVQKDNMAESGQIISELIAEGIGIMPETYPETLKILINSAKNVYLPANIYGGSERSVLESRACYVNVEVENDNPKLQELLTSPVYDYHYYAEQLKKGINSCL